MHHFPVMKANHQSGKLHFSLVPSRAKDISISFWLTGTSVSHERKRHTLGVLYAAQDGWVGTACEAEKQTLKTLPAWLK